MRTRVEAEKDPYSCKVHWGLGNMYRPECRYCMAALRRKVREGGPPDHAQ